MSLGREITADWIAVDWGTSRLRAWAMSASGTILAEGSSEAGMGGLDREGFEPALLELANDWLGAGRTHVVACGMVGSRQGWVEAPYAAAPCDALPAGFATAPTSDPRISVHVIPGIKQTKSADVMRGEETQIAGFLSLNPRWDGVICLPGTHTKWALISAGEVVSFQTFMTGELFALLSAHSVLRHSVAADGWDQTAFDTALGDAMSRPEAIAAKLFSLRADHLLNGLGADAAKSRLSGLLIGAELAAARPYWLGQQIALIGAQKMSETYAAALAAQGSPATIANGSRMTLAGLTAAYRNLTTPTSLAS